MKRLLNLILITILALSTLKVQAQTLSGDQIKANISRQVVESYARYTDAELKATVIALPFQNMVAPDGKVTYVVSSTMDKFMARDLKKVNVYVNDKFVRTFNAPVDTHAFKSVLVATGFIERDKILNSNSVESKKMDVSNNLEYILTSNLLDKEIVTKKTFRAGEVIDKRFVKLRPDVQRNANITLYFSTGNLMVEMDAISLSDGMLGDYVNVENKNYKKSYTGKVIGENKVLVKI